MRPNRPDNSAYPKFESDEEMGEWLHAHLADKHGFETRPAAVPRARRALKRQARWDRLRRVKTALQAGWPAAVQRRVEILCMKQVNAFVAPGRYIYITDALLGRLPTDDAVALVIGHELAHAELGHLFEFRRAAIWKDWPAGDILAVLVHALQRFAHSPENERDADAYGLDLTLKAGYDGEKCLEAFAILEAYMLSKGAHHLVSGPESAQRAAGDAFEEWRAKAEVWIWERRYGYPALRERRTALAERLEQHRYGDAPPLVLPGSHQSVAAVNSGFLARVRAIDAELERWSEELTALAANVADLLRLPTYRRLVAAVSGVATGLDGRTAREVEPALAVLQETIRQTTALLALRERAEEIRRFLSRDNPPPSALAELQGILFGGPAPLCAVATMAVSGMPGPPAADISVTARHLLGQLAAVFEDARAVVVAVDAEWSRWQPRMAACREDLDLLQQAFHAVLLDRGEALENLSRQVQSLERRIDSDPLAVAVDADAQIRAELTAARVEMLAKVVERREVEAALGRADRLLQRMRDGAEVERPSTTLTDLEERLITLHRLSGEGRMGEAAAGLAVWLSAAFVTIEGGAGLPAD